MAGRLKHFPNGSRVTANHHRRSESYSVKQQEIILELQRIALEAYFLAVRL